MKEKSFRARAAAGVTPASRQSSEPARNESSPSTTFHCGASGAAFAALAALVGTGKAATGVAVPPGPTPSSMRLILPAALRAASRRGASTSTRRSRAVRSSGRSSSMTTLMLPTSSSAPAAASTTASRLISALPLIRSESFGRCSKARRRSALSEAAVRRTGALFGR